MLENRVHLPAARPNRLLPPLLCCMHHHSSQTASPPRQQAWRPPTAPNAPPPIAIASGGATPNNTPQATAPPLRVSLRAATGGALIAINAWSTSVAARAASSPA